jgi:DNA polymerase
MNNAAVELKRISEQIAACQQCPLGQMRTKAVAGEGPPDAEIMLIGEGPGYHEDRQGRPFVGQSGRLLEHLLATIGLTREQVFITNVIKCRPPSNRDPLPQEIEACTPYLHRQIELISPLLLVTLGRFSMAQFFPASARITRIHGQPLRQEGRSVIPMFHPAAALRNPQWQSAMKQDFARIPALLEEARNERAAQAAAAQEPDDMEQLSFF